MIVAVPRGCLRFVIVVFPVHTHLFFLLINPILYLHSVDTLKICMKEID